MNSREDILAAVKAAQPDLRELPNLELFYKDEDSKDENLKNFIEVVERIGSTVHRVKNYGEVIEIINSNFALEGKVVVSMVKELDKISVVFSGSDNHELANVELMILPTHFAVAENGACWVDDELFKERLLPFIPQHLVFIVKKEEVVPTMHIAYERIADKKYGYGAFIAGPSKTADIEQSLVLGAHGPRSLTVFII